MTGFLTIGEPLVVLASEDVDVSLDEATHFTKFVAGAELNVAIGLSRLGHEAAFLSQVGNDVFGRFIIASAHRARLDVSYLKKTDKAQTGFYLKQKVSSGDPETAYFRKNSAAANLTSAEVENIDLSDIRLAHLSGIFAALSKSSLETFKFLNQRLIAAKILTVFDPNLRPALWSSKEQMIEVTNDLAKASQIILPGINEGKILTRSEDPETIADFYLNQSELTNTVVVKLGAEGAFVKSKSGKNFTVAGFHVEKVVDTVGAGDGFAVGLESALLEDWPIEDAVHRACAVGAMAVQTPGDNDGYPTREQLIDFLSHDSRLGNCS